MASTKMKTSNPSSTNQIFSENSVQLNFTRFKKISSNISLYLIFFAVFLSSAYAVQNTVDLGTAGNFIILSKSGITNTGSHTSNIVGNIGSSPITAAAMDNVFCSEITGTIQGVDAAYTGSGDSTCFAGNPGNKIAVDNAVLDMETAYTDASERTVPDETGLGDGDIGGMILAPGLYKWTTGVIIPSDVTLSGSSNDVWIFQIDQNLDVSSDTEIILMGGAQASNVFWQVAGQATLGTTSIFSGNILSQTAIVITTGAALNGRALAQTAVTLDSNEILLSIVLANTTNSTNQTTIPPTNTTNSTNPINSTLECFSNIQSLPANCTGTITQDSTSGKCRIISCSDVFGSVNTISCEKTDNTSTFFEMFRQSSIGTQPKVCLGNNCLKSGWGYQKGNNFPICTANITQAPIPAPQNTTTNQTNSSTTCFSWLKDIPAVCKGGTITQNTDLITYDNCRHVTCENGTNLVSVTACEKPDEINPTYFEMYRAQKTGFGIQICLGSACIQNNGFATQQFPVCTANITNPLLLPNTSNQPNQSTATSVNLSIAQWFPKGGNYVFICGAQGFTPISYDWTFGDGTKLRNYLQDNTYHSYSSGSYNITCTAKNNQVIKEGAITINV